MFIGDILVARGLATRDDVAAALELQRVEGGRLGDCLVRLGKITAEQIDAAMREAPRPPSTLAETGLSLPGLLNLMVKAIHSAGDATPSSICDTLKLPPGPVQELFEQADQHGLLEPLGATGGSGFAEIRYGLSNQGAQRARTAIEQSPYVGPAPVSLDEFRTQVARQRIINERVTRAMVDEALANLVVPDAIVADVGIAANASRPILLYGPTGNGKTSIGQRLGDLFKDVIYLPYSFEIDGQVVRVYDPSVHRRVDRQMGEHEPVTLRREDLDERWVACWRPLVTLGGELTLEMLQLGEDSPALYEAPPHVKALGGVLVIDDFGRQIVSPTALLNRWIVPLEDQVEYLTLRTGKTFQVPFDELVVFCTNLTPTELVDPAFLRRIPHKIEVPAPTEDDYRRIFRAVAQRWGVEVDDAVIDIVIEELGSQGGQPLAGYQPGFIVEQVVAAGKFAGVEPTLSREQISRALRHMYTREMREA